MKQKQLSQLKDGARFKFNKRTKVEWSLQNKFKSGGNKYATITATESGITKTKFITTFVWVES